MQTVPNRPPLPAGFVEVASDSGAVVHLVDGTWHCKATVCGRDVDRHRFAVVSFDQRRRCRQCAEDLDAAIRFQAYNLESERRRREEADTAAEFARKIEELKASSERRQPLYDVWREEARQRDLLAGITPEDRERLDQEATEQHISLAAALKAENDQLEAELQRRRTVRLVAG